MIRPRHLIVAAAAIAITTGCGDGMTNGEVLEALQESGDSSRGERAGTEPIEISTSFTIGQAVEAAAEELAAFWESQQPCTDVTWSGAELTIDYGGLDDTCEFNGSTYGGIAIVAIEDATLGSLEVSHTWDALNNGDVEVNGGALVTWDGSDKTRHVSTEHTWTDLEDGEEVFVVGEHIWGELDSDAGWLGGLTLDGTRDWTSDSGNWNAEIKGMELRLVDPVAQAGVVTVTNPDGRTLDMLHERLDENTIRVTISSGDREWVYDINRLGIPSEVEEGDGAATGS